MNNKFDINELLQLSVKIECRHEGEYSLGTGTVISDGCRFYVMTAGHCIKKEDGSSYDLSEIKILRYSYNTWQPITLLNIIVVDFSEEKDFAMLDVVIPEPSFDYFNNIKCCNTIINEECYAFLGYTKVATRGRMFHLKRSGIDVWHLSESNISNQELEAHSLMSGNSGAGVFFKRYGVYYYIGYLKKLLDTHGSYNDIIIYPPSNFDSFLPSLTKEENIVKLVDKWLEIEKEMVDTSLRLKYKENNVEYKNNLERKVQVLFSDKDTTLKRFDKFLNNYLNGLDLINLMKGNISLLKKLEDADRRVFENLNDYRNEHFNNDSEALGDLVKIKEELMNMASNIFIDDNAEKTIARGYADYSIAMKLLLCSLDYKQKKHD